MRALAFIALIGCGSAPMLPGHCGDHVRDGDETGLDCGGSCPGCAVGGGCVTHSDCAAGLVCIDLACSEPRDLAFAVFDLAVPLANTGEPCQAGSDCAGKQPVCVTVDNNGVTWPNGYCTSLCFVDKNDPQSGINPDCPGGQGTCIPGGGGEGACETACTAMGGAMPCARAGYSCFLQGCEPTARSQCNPTNCTKNACVAGTACFRVGLDPVGECDPVCDPFAQKCMPGDGCYPTVDCGAASCVQFLGNSGLDGEPCQYDNLCAPGLTCFKGFCRPLCGGPNMVVCHNGKACVDLSPTVKASVVGVCAG